jgi:DNA-binding Lrp family transcriptional regulator
MELIYFRSRNTKISYLTRAFKNGPEKELVEEYVKIIEKKIGLNKIYGYGIFIEPKLDVGFPDVVIVKYSRRIMSKWVLQRKSIDLSSLKILSHLFYAGSMSIDKITSDLGLDASELMPRLAHLQDAKLIYKKGMVYTAYPFKNSFAVREVIAVEAKMSNILGAIGQASNNKWFATSSYILTPSIKPTRRVTSQCEDLGLGIIGLKLHNMIEILPPRPHDLPKSYVSLLLNEWIGRKIVEGLEV